MIAKFLKSPIFLPKKAENGLNLGKKLWQQFGNSFTDFRKCCQTVAKKVLPTVVGGPKSLRPGRIQFKINRMSTSNGQPGQ